MFAIADATKIHARLGDTSVCKPAPRSYTAMCVARAAPHIQHYVFIWYMSLPPDTAKLQAAVAAVIGQGQREPLVGNPMRGPDVRPRPSSAPSVSGDDRGTLVPGTAGILSH